MSEFCPLLILPIKGELPDTPFCGDDDLPVIALDGTNNGPLNQHEGCLGSRYGARNCTFIDGIPTNFISYLANSGK